MSQTIRCPITKRNVVDQCKTCEYQEDCLEDILSDFEAKTMKLAAKYIRLIRDVINAKEKIKRGI